MDCTLTWNSCCCRCVFLSNIEFLEESTKLTIFWCRIWIFRKFEMKLRLLTNAVLKDNRWWCYFSSRTRISFNFFDSFLNARIEWFNFWERLISILILQRAGSTMSCFLQIREIVFKLKQKLNIIEIFLLFLNVFLLNSYKFWITHRNRIH